MELESKLDQDTDAKHELQLEIDKLKSNLSTVAEVSTEASELREKVYSLEKSVEAYRGKAREAKDLVTSLQEKLASATDGREQIEKTLKKVNGERAEVIVALEGVINEVQNREDEIESLSELLHRRDEELQHAKTIATKALQSAKDIQKRYKEKDMDRHSVLESMDELNDKVDVLTSKNDTLQRKISMLERDLRDRNLECKRLKDQLRQIDGKQLRENDSSRVNDNVSAFSGTQDTYCSSRTFSNAASSGSMGGMGMRIDTSAMDPHDGMGMETDSFSPSASPRSGGDNMFEKEVEYPAFDKQPSLDSDDAGSSTIITNDASNRWAQDFDSESRSGFDSISSGRSRRSIERDALRKYVRQRYMSKRSDSSVH
jgi:outer membrane murein-binding lipoprotein Lpp